MRHNNDILNDYTIWASADRGLVFHITSTGNLECIVTEDSGATWNPPVVLIKDFNIRSVRVRHYRLWRGASRFDETLDNRMAVIANSVHYVYVYFMDIQSLEVLDIKKKYFPVIITNVESYLAQDGSLKLMILPGLSIDDDLSGFFSTHSIRK